MDDKILQLLQSLENKMLTKDDAKNFATKDDLEYGLLKMRDGLTSVMVTKYDLYDLREMIEKLGKRTDEDLRAVMKDVEILKSKFI